MSSPTPHLYPTNTTNYGRERIETERGGPLTYNIILDKLYTDVDDDTEKNYEVVSVRKTLLQKLANWNDLIGNYNDKPDSSDSDTSSEE